MTPRLRRCLAAIVAVMAAHALSACVSGRSEVAMPAAWSASPGRIEGTDGWWRRMGDPLLASIVDEAVGPNLDMAATAARIRAARAARVEAAAAGLPSLGSAATGSRASANSLYQGGFDAGWELDLFGGIARSVEAASLAEDGAVEGARATALSLIGDVARAYVEARGYQARIAVARRAAASQRDTLGITRARLSAGVATDVDVGKAEALAASTEANIPTLETAYAQAVHRLGVLSGREPGALVPVMARRMAVPRPGPLPVSGIPADAVRARPDVRKAEKALAEAAARVGVAEAALRPSLRLSGTLSLSAATLAGLGSGTGAWAFGPSLDLPRLDGGARAAAVDAREADRDAAGAAYRASVLAAAEEVGNALVALSRERARFARLSASAAAYRRAEALSRSLYERGAAGFLDVLDAQRSLYQAEDSLEQSRVLLVTGHVALCKALGGGWDGSGGRSAARDRMATR